MLHIKLRLLQLVDVLVDFLQLGCTRSTIEVSIGGLSDVAQRRGIDFHRDIDILYASCHRHRIRRHLVGSHTNGIDSDAVALGYLGSGHRRDVTHVVTTVGEQDYHLALCLGILESGHGVGKSHSHSGTVVDESASLNIGAGVMQESEQTGMIGGHRTLRESLAGKDGESDIVGRTA